MTTDTDTVPNSGSTPDCNVTEDGETLDDIVSEITELARLIEELCRGNAERRREIESRSRHRGPQRHLRLVK
jgi:hypothetical protein